MRGRTSGIGRGRKRQVEDEGELERAATASLFQTPRLSISRYSQALAP